MMARVHRLRIVENPCVRYRLWERAIKCWYACDWQGIIFAAKRLIEMDRSPGQRYRNPVRRAA